MFRNTDLSLVTVIFSAALAAPAPAQDMPVLDPSAYSRPMVMHGAINAQARRAKARRGATSIVSARTCANKAQARTRLGASHPGVAQLYEICAKQGM